MAQGKGSKEKKLRGLVIAGLALVLAGIGISMGRHLPHRQESLDLVVHAV